MFSFIFISLCCSQPESGKHLSEEQWLAQRPVTVQSAEKKWLSASPEGLGPCTRRREKKVRAGGPCCGMLSSGPAAAHMNSCLWSSAQIYSMLDGQLTDAGEREPIYLGGGAVATGRLPMPHRCSKAMHIWAALIGLWVIKNNLLFKSSDLVLLSIHHTKLWMWPPFESLVADNAHVQKQLFALSSINLPCRTPGKEPRISEGKSIVLSCSDRQLVYEGESAS